MRTGRPETSRIVAVAVLLAAIGCRDAPSKTDGAASVAPQPSAAPSAPAVATGASPSDAGRPVPSNVVYERFEDLGPSYRLRHYGVRSSGFEAIAHYTALLHGQEVLTSGVGFHSLSPDGAYVVYEADGHVWLHGAASDRKVSMTPTPFVLPTRATWDMAHRKVTVTFTAPTPPKTAALF